MFERFTEQSRRVVFFARFAAAQARHSHIDSIDLLHGLAHDWVELREGLGLPEGFLLGKQTLEQHLEQSFWKRLFSWRVSPSQQIPFSETCKRVLRSAAELAEQANSPTITARHLLIGLCEQDSAIAGLLAEKNIKPENLRRIDEWESPVTGFARVGIGYDYHRLVAGRKLMLGGVEIPFDKGLVGHSDGDVLAHALCDAILGAAGLGDIGQHFPDTDPQWKDVSSLELLRRGRDLITEKRLRVVQADTLIVAEAPRLAPHFDRMRETLARTLGLEPAQLNVKAKTTEGQEAIGRGEAMAAHAIVLLESV